MPKFPMALVWPLRNDLAAFGRWSMHPGQKIRPQIIVNSLWTAITVIEISLSITWSPISHKTPEFFAPMSHGHSYSIFTIRRHWEYGWIWSHDVTWGRWSLWLRHGAWRTAPISRAASVAVHSTSTSRQRSPSDRSSLTGWRRSQNHKKFGFISSMDVNGIVVQIFCEDFGGVSCVSNCGLPVLTLRCVCQIQGLPYVTPLAPSFLGLFEMAIS